MTLARGTVIWYHFATLSRFLKPFAKTMLQSGRSIGSMTLQRQRQQYEPVTAHAEKLLISDAQHDDAKTRFKPMRPGGEKSESTWVITTKTGRASNLSKMLPTIAGLCQREAAAHK
jgi:hypothetical protein